MYDFEFALDLAKGFTRQILVEVLDNDGNPIETSRGTCILLNKHGVVLTAAHVLPREKRPVAIMVQMFEGEKLDDLINIVADHDIDLAMLQFKQLKPSQSTKFPVFEKLNLNCVPVGREVVKFGFALGAESSPLAPWVPVPGLVARWETVANKQGQSIRMLSTTGPNLPGQSGGPILDREGHVLGIINNTCYYKIEMPAPHGNGNFPMGNGISSNEVVAWLGQHGVTLTDKQFISRKGFLN